MSPRRGRFCRWIEGLPVPREPTCEVLFTALQPLVYRPARHIDEPSHLQSAVPRDAHHPSLKDCIASGGSPSRPEEFVVKKNNLILAAALMAAFGAGLAWAFYGHGQSGGVAVIDLDEVARQLGKDAEIVNSYQAQASALQNQLNAAEQRAVQELKKIREGLGEVPSEDESRKLLTAQRNAQVNLNKMRNQASALLSKHRQQIVSDFRESTKPVVAEVARGKGLATVMTRNDSVVFSFDQTVDITNEVVARLRAQAPATPAVQQVAAQAPASAKSQVQTASAEAPAESK